MALQANELRIGNWVIWDNPILNIRERVQINWEDFELITNKNLGNKYTPIPLTPEILEKCGFVRNGDWFYKQSFVLGFLTTDSNFQTEFKFAGTELPFKWNLLNITSLHQLQNLYFALTQTELLIKL